MHSQVLWRGACIAILCAWPAAAAVPAKQFSALRFEPHSSGNRLISRGGLHNLLLGAGGDADYDLHLEEDAFLRFRLLAAAPALPEGEERLPSITNIYSGADPRLWRIGVPNYSRVRYRSIYAGIDLLFRGANGELEHDFIVKPGGDPRRIRFFYLGARSLEVAANGDLLIYMDYGTVRQAKPVAYQTYGAKRVLIAATYKLTNSVAGFEIGTYNPKRTLIIDPVIKYSSYLGGSGFDTAYGIAADSAGNAYVTGETASTDFPAASGFRQNRDVFVTKLNSQGSALVYTTVFSSAGNDMGRAITVDANGNAYVTGAAGGSGFPVTPNGFQTSSAGLADAFVAKLDATGAIVYSTYIGGSGADAATGIAIDPAGQAVIAGQTTSPDFRTTAGAAQIAYRGGLNDAFVTKLNASGTGLVYSTLLGGAGNELANAVQLDPAGKVYICGFTDSEDLPAGAGFQPRHGGGGDGFAARLNATGTQWEYVTYLGGTGPDQANGIAVDSVGGAIVAGETFSADFPIRPGAIQMLKRSGYDGFVAKLDASGSGLVFSTFFGGNGADSVTSVAADPAGRVWLTGFTSSTDLPLAGASQNVKQSGFDAFVSQIDAAGSSLLFSTYAGGSDDDRGFSIALNQGIVVITGLTASLNFPITNGSAQSVPPAPYNAFVRAIVGNTPPSIVSLTPSSGSGLSQNFTLQISDPDGASDVARVQFLFNSSFSGINACLLMYRSDLNAVFLLNNASNAWVGSVLAGASGTLQNSQCSVQLTPASISVSGNLVTLTVSILFKPSFAGSKTVFVEAADLAGLQLNWTPSGTWAVVNSPPSVAALTPSSGSGLSQTLTLQISDPDGASDIARVQLLFNSSFSGINACLLMYRSDLNSLFLLNNASNAWVGSVPAGASGILQNSQCSVQLTPASISASGNLVTLMVSILFKPSFAGSKTVFVEAADLAGLQLNWAPSGTWTVVNSPPSVAALTPSSGAGLSQNFTLQISDPDGASDIARVQLLFNSSFSGINACLLMYRSDLNAVFLLNNASNAWVGSVLAGASGTLQNTQCSVQLTPSSISVSGNLVTLTVSILFKPSFAGSKTVFVEAADLAGLQLNWTPSGTWTVVNSPPFVTALFPSSGAGLSRTFTLQISDADGASDIAHVQLLFNSSFSGINGCLLLYRSDLDGILLLNDASNAWVGLVPAGASGTLQNTQCSVQLNPASISVSGNLLTLTVFIVFKASFAGPKTVFVQAADTGGAQLNWTPAGSWTATTQ